jgi:inorganic pyrophosphatase
MNLDRVPAGTDVPNDCNVIVEIPMRGDPIKYEVDKETGAVFVDRFMSTAMPCVHPGWLQRRWRTASREASVLSPVPLISLPPGAAGRSGCSRWTMRRVVTLRSGAGSTMSGLYRAIQSPRDLPELTTRQIAHFFEHYKDLEPGKWVRVSTWVGAEEAKAEIVAGVARYHADQLAPRP